MKESLLEDDFGIGCELCGSVGHKKEECPFSLYDSQSSDKPEKTEEKNSEFFEKELFKRGEEFEEMMKLIQETEKKARKEAEEKKDD